MRNILYNQVCSFQISYIVTQTSVLIEMNLKLSLSQLSSSKSSIPPVPLLLVISPMKHLLFMGFLSLHFPLLYGCACLVSSDILHYPITITSNPCDFPDFQIMLLLWFIIRIQIFMSYIRLHVEHYFRWKSKKFCKEVSTFTHHSQVWKVRTF